MNETVDLDYDYKVRTIFNQAAEAAIKIVDTELFRDFRLSYPQLGVMYAIKNSSKPLSPTELSRILLREPHTTAALINRMQKQGLIKKTRDPHMKNIKRVSLTVAGEMLYSKAMERETTNDLLSCLSPEEKESLLICSEKIRKEALNRLTVRRLWEPLFS